MALSDRQKADCQRWMGYGLTDRIGYGRVVPVEPLGLEEALASLTADEEAIITERFLDLLPDLEQGVLDAAVNLDTQVAGPWTANPREVAQRKGLYNSLRRELCAFLGFAPGPSLTSGGMTALLA
jgi:hypothetical protein